MNRNIIVMGILAVMMSGCRSSVPVMYSHKDGTDWLTAESKGDSIGDYASLKRRGEEMCRVQGNALGIEVVLATPSHDRQMYTVAYRCIESDTVTYEAAKSAVKRAVDTTVEVVRAGSAKVAEEGWAERAQEKFNELRAAIRARMDK